MTLESRLWLVVIAFILILILMTCSHPAFTDELDEAEEQLQGVAPLSWRDTPEFTEDQINRISKMHEELK